MPTHDGGKPNVKPLPYSAPKGPTNQMRQGVGLGGTNYGPCGSQGEYSLKTKTSGSPGIGGTNHGNKGSQDAPQY